ncbi:hypothetical protein EYF80_005123 [Liparis tanakae]|uniref:Uncharacterized protein n=1 Tax=Liparis tanakae TaxID=230148 RepID=A0A4Z2J4U0_9TELE|nr:hypothetical protein EYF80_005123 [Liparis tanakae]
MRRFLTPQRWKLQLQEGRAGTMLASREGEAEPKHTGAATQRRTRLGNREVICSDARAVWPGFSQRGTCRASRSSRTVLCCQTPSSSVTAPTVEESSRQERKGGEEREQTEGEEWRSLEAVVGPMQVWVTPSPVTAETKGTDVIGCDRSLTSNCSNHSAVHN